MRGLVRRIGRRFDPDRRRQLSGVRRLTQFKRINRIRRLSRPSRLIRLGTGSGAGVNRSFHDADGSPLIDLKAFPNMSAMTGMGRALGIESG
eukprot:gene18053-biopygen34348